jgi:hypothetical protein
MTDFFGIGPTSTQNPWTDFFCDGGFAIADGAVVTHVLVHSNTPGATIHPRIMRLVAGNQYECAASGLPFAHPGGGYAAAPLAAPFAKPAGVHRVAAGIAGTVTRSQEPAPRLYKNGPQGGISGGIIVGTVLTFNSDPAGLPPLGYRTQNGGASPPPSSPPPSAPPTNGARIVVLSGQSGSRRVFEQAAAVLTGAFQALVPATTLDLRCTAHNGSTYGEWAPGGAYLAETIATFQSAFAAGAAPGALVWDLSENPACYVDQAIRADELDAAIFAHVRAQPGLAELPILINEAHMNFETGLRPWWKHVQDKKRLVCDPTWRNHVPGTHLVSVADLGGAPGDLEDAVHLSVASNQIKGRRWGAALGMIYLP